MFLCAAMALVLLVTVIILFMPLLYSEPRYVRWSSMFNTYYSIIVVNRVEQKFSCCSLALFSRNGFKQKEH
jgi:hypothetical protein